MAPPLLVVSYEFTHSPFSGNGVLARSLVKGLLAQGHSVHVLCCRPAPAQAGEDRHITEAEVGRAQAAALRLHTVQLSLDAGWRRLDRNSGWSEFVQDARARASELVSELGCGGAAVVIDWTGGAAWRAMGEALSGAVALPVCLYINFRVYASGLDPADASVAWYNEQERRALQVSGRALALSARDQAALRELRSPGGDDPALDVGLLLPCLRGDMEALATGRGGGGGAGGGGGLGLEAQLPPAASEALAAAAGASASRRRFVSCVVRASPEKNPALLASLLERTTLGAELRRRGLVPLVSCCGPSADELKARVRAAAADAAILDTFLGPAALAAIYAATALNLHPCLYDAFGMSVVEAAAFGAPSVVNAGDTVGAMALLGEGGSVCIDLQSPLDDIAAQILAALDDADALAATAARAREKALSWGEVAAGRELSDSIRQLLERRASSVP